MLRLWTMQQDGSALLCGSKLSRSAAQLRPEVMEGARDEWEPVLLPPGTVCGGIQATFTYSRPGQAKHKSGAVLAVQQDKQPGTEQTAEDAQPGNRAVIAVKQDSPQIQPGSASPDSPCRYDASPSASHHRSTASPAPGHALSRFHPSYAGAAAASQQDGQPAAEQQQQPQPQPSPARRVRLRTAKVENSYEEAASSEAEAADSPDVRLAGAHAVCWLAPASEPDCVQESFRSAPTRKRGRATRQAKVRHADTAHTCSCMQPVGRAGTHMTDLALLQAAAASPDRRGSCTKARTSQYNGVGRAHRKQEWQARIQVDGKVSGTSSNMPCRLWHCWLQSRG